MTVLRVLLPLIFLISATASVAAPAIATSTRHTAPSMSLSDCHETAAKGAVNPGKTAKGEPSDTCCDKACTCVLSHCQPAAPAPDAVEAPPEPSANSRYEAFSRRLLSAIREQVKPPPKS